MMERIRMGVGLSSLGFVDIAVDIVVVVLAFGIVIPAKENKYLHSGRSDCNSEQEMDKMGRVKRCFK